MAISWEKRQARKLQWAKQGLQNKDEGPDLMLAKFAFLGSGATILMALGVVLAAVAVMFTPYLMWHYPWVIGAMLAGSVWPVARLMYLNNHNDILQHDGVYNPRTQRALAYVALGLLTIAVVCIELGSRYDTSAYGGTVAAAFSYMVITYLSLEFSLPRWVEGARSKIVLLREGAGALLALFLLVILMLLPQTAASEEDDSD